MPDRLLKAVVVLSELPEDQAASLLRRVDPEVVGLADQRKREVGGLSAENREACLREFILAVEQPLHSLQQLAPNAVVGLLRDEHPQVIACVLTRQSTRRMQNILSALPVDMRLDVTDRLRLLGPVDPNIVSEIEEVLSNRSWKSQSSAA